mgnify:CR=1 FL=1
MDNKLINEIISLAENGGARGNDITAVYSRVYIALKKSLGICLLYTSPSPRD